MDYRRVLRTWFVAMLVSVLATGLQPANIAGAAQGSDVLVENSFMIVVQGENDIVPGNESSHDFYALKIMSFDLPYDATRIHTRVPPSAEDFYVWTAAGEINESAYGFETGGEDADEFYVDVPGTHPRTGSFLNSTETEASFTAPGSEFTNTTYSSSALRLTAGNDSGEFVSALMLPLLAHQATSATLSFNGNSSSNITSYLSNDGGSNWISCMNNTVTNFSTQGTSLRVKFGLEGNASAGYEPYVSSFCLNATYVLNYTIFTVHISYVWRDDFRGGRATFDFSEALDFAAGGNYVLMLYLMPGYEIESSELDLIYDSTGSLSSYPDKNLYYNMTSVTSPMQSLDVVVLAPPKESKVIFYAVAAALIAAFCLALFYSRRLKSRAKARKPSISDHAISRAEPVVDTIAEDQDALRRQLVARKKELLTRIEGIRKASSGFALSKTQEDELVSLKNEYKTVRNELNRIPKQSPGEGQQSESSASDYESLLATIARLDNDFEKGRLPEGAYKTLRKDYLSKAATLLALAEPEESPLESEKKKLMEAIVVLDEERERGEIDEKVYAELKASYRKQLVEMMKESERRSS